MVELINLQTDRIILRPWKDADIEPFIEMSFLPTVSKYLPPFPNKEACCAFANKLIADFENDGYGFWVLEDKQSGLFAGIAGIHRPGPEFGVGFPCTEIGWRLDPKFWGLGLATEAAMEIMRFAFQDLRLNTLVSFAAKGNSKSIKVMERLGMKKEREFEMLLFPPGHKHRLHCLYMLVC